MSTLAAPAARSISNNSDFHHGLLGPAHLWAHLDGDQAGAQPSAPHDLFEGRAMAADHHRGLRVGRGQVEPVQHTYATFARLSNPRK